jgi:UDP-2,3-diacylglucosamine pyrophosphatase LpxH
MTKRKEAFKSFTSILEDREEEYSRKLPVGGEHKYAVFSDLHLQDGKKKGDRFARNREVFKTALEYYRQNDYSIILLGDIEDFHQHTLEDIHKKYHAVYELFLRFPAEKLHRIYGNHDIEWSWNDPLFSASPKTATQAIKLGNHIILTHGHQAEEWYEADLHVVRFGTFLGKYAEKIFSTSSESSVTQRPNSKDEIYFDWAEENKKILICGHTHNPVFASKPIMDMIPDKMSQLKQEREIASGKGEREKVKALKKRLKWFEYQQKLLAWQENHGWGGRRKIELDENAPYYFNTGGGIYCDGITNIEISGSSIGMAFWGNEDKQRELVTEPRDMNNILGFDITS